MIAAEVLAWAILIGLPVIALIGAGVGLGRLYGMTARESAIAIYRTLPRALILIAAFFVFVQAMSWAGRRLF